MNLATGKIILILISIAIIVGLLNQLLSLNAEFWMELTFVFCTSVFVVEYFIYYVLLLLFYFLNKSEFSKNILIIYSIYLQAIIFFAFLIFFIRYYFFFESSFYQSEEVSVITYSSNIILSVFLISLWRLTTPSFVNDYMISRKSIKVYLFSFLIQTTSYFLVLTDMK